MTSSQGSEGPRLVILRVKRARETATGESNIDADRVFVKCRDLKLDVGVVADGDARYRFVRVDACGRGSTASGSASASVPSGGTERGGKLMNDTVVPAEALLSELSLAETHPRGVKALPTAQEVAARSLQRSVQLSITRRSVLRCSRVRLLRSGAGSSALCIDCVTGEVDGEEFRDSFSDTDGPAEVKDFDVYRLDGIVDENDEDDCGLHWASSTFDDSDDEFSFEPRSGEVDGERNRQQCALHTRRDRKVRKALHEARTMDLLGVPLPNDWLPHFVTSGDDDNDHALLQLAAALPNAPGPLLLDDCRPAGLDNYLQYDHRHDDEYDSNAEDRQDDYPDESASPSEGGTHDEWGECHGDDGEDSDADYGGGGRRRGAPLYTAESEDELW